MENLRSAPLMIGLILLAVVFVVIGVLYGAGVINFLTTHPNAKNHYDHAILFGVLALASLVAASFVRPRTA
jgi:ABC-type thiamin/hydroxymethylpyrimidine transport system permease subunit